MPLARSLGNAKGSKMVPVGSNGPQITHLIIPEGPGSPLKKHIFDPFGTPFQAQNDPFSSVLRTSRESKMSEKGSNRP